jgi:hypothetical protein
MTLFPKLYVARPEWPTAALNRVARGEMMLGSGVKLANSQKASFSAILTYTKHAQAKLDRNFLYRTGS